MISYTLDKLQEVFQKKGYTFFTDNSKPYNLNIIGIRASDMTSNQFNDEIVVCYPDGDLWRMLSVPATTDPGTAFRLDPIDDEFGTAILVPGQYRGAYQRGIHRAGTKFAHEALRQVIPLPVYRDNNRDNVLDVKPETIRKGLYGINIHRASISKTASTVDYYSAGCQVVQRASDFLKIMELVKKAEKYWGKSFTYTLIEEKDLI